MSLRQELRDAADTIEVRRLMDIVGYAEFMKDRTRARCHAAAAARTVELGEVIESIKEDIRKRVRRTSDSDLLQDVHMQLNVLTSISDLRREFGVQFRAEIEQRVKELQEQDQQRWRASFKPKAVPG